MTQHALRSACLRVATLLVAATTSVAAQTTYTVPGTHATIQAALDAAVDGDTVLVGPGTYAESLTLTSKTITLESSAGAASTIVDSTGVGPRTLLVSASPSAAAVVRGFTFTGGTISGIEVSIGSTTFEDCVVTGNTATYGGGVHAAAVATPTFIGCTIRENEGSVDGGGVFGPATLIDTLVASNTSAFGGGAYLIASAVGCTFQGNHAFTRGGGAFGPPDAYSHCTFVDNFTNGDGGGLAYFQVLGPEFIPIRDLVFIGNHATGRGGAIFREVIYDMAEFFDIHQVLERSVFRVNTSTGGLDAIDSIGGIVNPFATNPFEVTQCTFSGDTLAAGAFTTLTVNSSIFYNQPGPIAGGSSVTVSYSMVQGGWPGIGNTATNPMFVDTANHDLHLQPGSVCINAGDPGLPLDADGSRADMGALPYVPWSDVEGTALSGNSAPTAHANGPLEGGTTTLLGFEGATAASTAYLVLGFSELSAPFKLGVLVPFPDLVVPVPVPGTGALDLTFPWPGGVPAGAQIWLQWWFTDVGAPAGFASTQGIVGTTP